jgi:uncharacterized protein YgbK (DUF1537 family)
MNPSTRIRVLIVADDLTGAMDSAVPFASRGLRVKVIPSPEKQPSTVLEAEVIAIATNTRHSPPDEAAATVERVARQALSYQPEIVIKKVDSTLRGRIAEECRAMSDALGKESLIVCPAVPSQQRSVINGEIHLGEIPLRKTAFASDIRSPAPAVPMEQLFQKQFGGWDIFSGKAAVAARGNQINHRQSIIIFDARTDGDIRAVINNRRSQLEGDLLIGASGLTEAVAQVLLGSVRPGNKGDVSSAGKFLFVLGSAALETARQLDTLSKNHAVSLHELTDAEPLNATTAASLDVKSTIFVLKAPDREQSGQLDSGAVLYALAISAAHLISRFNISNMLLTGGDTCEATLAQLSVEAVTVQGEIQPGTVYGNAETAEGKINLVTKAGGFGQPDLFLDVLHFFNF